MDLSVEKVLHKKLVQMNTNEEALDLGLALGSKSYLVQTGAGVNANPRADIAFAASDTLSELVWSPRHGLSLKSTDSSLADKRPLLLWNMGTSSINESIRSQGSNGDEEMMIISRSMLDENGKFSDKPTSVRSPRSSPNHDVESNSKLEDESGNQMAIEKGKNIEEDLRSSPNVQIADIAESSRKIAAVVSSAEQDTLANGTHGTTEVEPSASSNDVMDLNLANHSKVLALQPSEALPLSKLESSAENNLACHFATNSGVRSNRDKGKEKALSDGDAFTRSSSHGSVESCNSVGLFSKGINKRDSSYDYEEETQFESKRTKLQIQGSHEPKSNFRHDSSFMNWISNMVKCLSDCNKVESSFPALPPPKSNDVDKKNQGNFNNVFRSLYHRKPETLEAGVEKVNYPVQEPEEVMAVQEPEEVMAEARKSPEHIPRLCGGDDDKELNLNRNRDFVRQSNNPGTSLWIIRYCTSKPSPENYKLITNERFNENCSSYHGGEPSSKRIEFQKSAGSNLKNDLEKELEFSPRTVESKVAPEHMFHAIRKLSLSRADILRWMSSNISLPCINGFFLRLRLGKLEAGLGGTGYYIARITGDTSEQVGCKSKNSILVDVGGIKTYVGSQYVSNHDFLEDEINTWWCRTVKTGGKIPSLDELNLKLKDRICLGF